VDHITSPRRTQRQVMSGGGETGKQAAALGRGATRRSITVVVEQAATIRAWRVSSKMDGETSAIREEGESVDFLFLFSCGWQCCLLERSGIEAHQRVSG
jgi:hypothetical protein